MRVLIDREFGGGFNIYGKAEEALRKAMGLPDSGGLFCFSECHRDLCPEDVYVERHDERLLAIWDAHRDWFSKDHVAVEIPDGTDYVIENYDGAEWVAERHQTWHEGERGTAP